MEPLGIHGVFVEASANTFNPLHNGDDEGAHSVLESSVPILVRRATLWSDPSYLYREGPKKIELAQLIRWMKKWLV